MKVIATILIIGGLAAAIFTLGRSVTYFANNEDTGINLFNKGQDANSLSAVSAGDLPVELDIPKLNIAAKVQRLGIDKKGNMAAPNNFTDVSWYKYGTVPGLLGSAVIAGHEDNAISLDGVFKHLDELQTGDDIYVVTDSGKRLHFRVSESKIYPYNLSGPELEKIFTAADKVRLNLITCAGVWLKSAKTNDKRLVVFTELVK
jgi:LPXTG-site transpeptidase (sortase) family protein